MKDQIIKLHDEFVNKGMKKSVWVCLVFKDERSNCLERTIHGDNTGYILLDMQTWLRKEHRIHAFAHPFEDLNSFLAVIDAKTPSGFERLYTSDGEFEDYKEALLSGLREAITLIE